MLCTGLVCDMYWLSLCYALFSLCYVLVGKSPKVAHKRTPFKDHANMPEIRKMLFKVEPTSETKSKPTIVHKVHSSTQTDDIEEEGISVVIFAFLSIFAYEVKFGAYYTHGDGGTSGTGLVCAMYWFSLCYVLV